MTKTVPVRRHKRSYAQDAGLPGTGQEAWPEASAREEAQAFLTQRKPSP
jgi:hypothetical protein